ncbi:MAG: alpha/beta hydrolase [Deltaproteobacteria bacterium]|nr:alpha/beta hydrolase [Deltaproteobacteria bacterium]
MTLTKRSFDLKSADGLTLRADAWGDESSQPVLLLHGGGQTRHAWAGTGEKLAADGWYAVSMDLRGHGESEWCPKGNYDHGDFALDTAHVAGSFSRKPVLVGASLGGLSSLLALGNHKSETEAPLASGLVLVDIAPRMELAGAQRVLDFMRSAPNGFASLDEAADAIAEYNPHRPRPKDHEGLAKNLRKHEDGRYRWHWDPAFIDGRLESGRPDHWDNLETASKGLTLPTLLVRGKMSDLITEEGAQAFLEQVPHAKYTDVSGAGHMVAGDRNDKFTQAVLEFLNTECREPQEGS